MRKAFPYLHPVLKVEMTRKTDPLGGSIMDGAVPKEVLESLLRVEETFEL